MTDAQKIEALTDLLLQKIESLTDLLGDVIHSLEMKQFEIDDPTESHKCEVEADKFHQQMLNILYPDA